VSTSTRGACLCGAVTFAIAPPYRWFAHCHCSLCRKQHGTPFGTSLGVESDKLDWLSGAPLRGLPRGAPRRGLPRGAPLRGLPRGADDDVVHYRATPLFERPFCRHCGSAVPAVSHDPRFWHVPAGLLDGDPGARPRSHIFVASRSSLHEIADALPQYAAYPPGFGLPVVEQRVQSPFGDFQGSPAAAGTIVGSCLCDGVAFSVTATPQRLVNCYCSLCRRRSGAAFTSTLLAPSSEFRWLRGESRIRRYALPSPRQYGTDFCAECGSPAPTVVAGAATVMLPAGAIDTDLPPLTAVHVHVGSKAPWYSITDAWPQFAELPPGDPW
jgi:hypothetical protein